MTDTERKTLIEFAKQVREAAGFLIVALSSERLDDVELPAIKADTTSLPLEKLPWFYERYLDCKPDRRDLGEGWCDG